jgi:hypothetical protein
MFKLKEKFTAETRSTQRSFPTAVGGLRLEVINKCSKLKAESMQISAGHPLLNKKIS